MLIGTPPGRASSGSLFGGGGATTNRLTYNNNSSANHSAGNGGLHSVNATTRTHSRSSGGGDNFNLGKEYSGMIKSYNPEKGYGFIDCAGVKAHFGRDVFLSKPEVDKNNLQ